MNQVELDMMQGMVSILNEASQLMTEEQYNTRLEDLKQLEEETGYMLLNSPNCKVDLKSIVEIVPTYDFEFKNRYSLKDIMSISNKDKLIAYIDINGDDISIAYINGVISRIYIKNVLLNVKAISNIFYKINSEKSFCIDGKVVSTDKMMVFVDNFYKGTNDSFKDNLKEVKELGFKVVPFWSASNLNAKNFQDVVDFVFEYAENEELPCSGISFRYDDIKYGDDVIYKIKK